MSSLFQIPGNIKQQYLPFVLKPGDDMSKNAESSTELKGASPQFFSFRNRNGSDYKGGFGRVQICPSSLTNVDFGGYFDQDASVMPLFGEQDSSGKRGALTVDGVLNAMPGVQIREFLPDTKLDQCINFFGELMDSFKDIFSDSQDEAKAKSKQAKKDGKSAAEIKKIEKDSQAGFWKKFRQALSYAFDWMTATGSASPEKNSIFYRNGQARFPPGFDESVIDSRGKLDTYLLTFPYQLYYRLQSCVTTNIYELPGKTADDLLYSAQGDKGWDGGKAISVGNSFLSKIPVIGGILNNVLGNIQINYMPWWDSGKGSGTQPPQVEITFDLFNDTAEAAMMNFIFVNTVVPNNMWIQYGMFQHSSHLYDVKIDGYNRLFACSGNFSVKSKGVLRNPPRQWVRDLCLKYGNGDMGGKKDGGNWSWTGLFSAITENNLIKIPDVYEVKMTFQSLLPLNFNNYIYTYSQNNRMEKEWLNGQPVYTGSVMAKIATIPTDFVGDVVKYWKSDDINKDIAAKEAAKKNGG